MIYTHVLKVGGAGALTADALPPSLVRGRAAQVNPGGFTTPARRPSVPHQRPVAESPPASADGRQHRRCLMDQPSAAIVQSASTFSAAVFENDKQPERLLQRFDLQPIS